MKASTKSISRSHLSINQGSLWEEFTDILPSTAAALKDILTEKGFHTKSGKVESLISCMIIAANKSSKRLLTTRARAFYEERFPTVEVNWIRILHRITLNF
jgi:hypothetical protein